MARLLSGLVGAYQLVLRPMLPPSCRFEPSCSEYYRLALKHHSVARATGLAILRIARCHPWHAGGYDPVPPGRADLRGKSSA